MTGQFLASSDSRVPLSVVLGLAVVAGLLVGSFINVVVYRVPRGLSVSKPRSFCPTCQRQLSWWENAPVISWVGLRGRCRTCHEPISIRYPLVEAGMAAIFVLIAWALGGSLMTLPYCLLGATIVSILLIDTGDLRSPLWLAASGTVIGDASLVAVAAAGSHWAVLIGGQIGTSAGILAFGALRRLDPESRRDVGIGRSALIPAGCWFGGLGVMAASIGVGAFAVVFVVCFSLRRLTGKSRGRANSGSGQTPTLAMLRILADRPMILAVTFGATSGLITFAR